MANPMQELWFNRNRHRLDVPVAVGVSDAFEIISGPVRQAPRLIKQLKLEWIFPNKQDPQLIWRDAIAVLLKLGVMMAPLIY